MKTQVKYFCLAIGPSAR